MERDIELLLVGLAAGGVISLILGYFVNLTTPNLQKRIFERRNTAEQKKARESIKKARKRTEFLEHEIKVIDRFYENPVSLIGYAFLQLFLTLITYLLTGSCVATFLLLGNNMGFEYGYVIAIVVIIALVVKIIFDTANTADTFLRVWIYRQFRMDALKEIEQLTKYIEEKERPERPKIMGF
jgi:hypothetical protein